MSSYPRYRALFDSARPVVPTQFTVPIKVLKRQQAPLILCFLRESFKTGDYSPVLPGEKIVGQLTSFLETWEPEEDEEGVLTLGLPCEERAARLLKDWVREGYLTLYSDDNGEDQHSLTPELESVLDWVHSLLDKPAHVGTESRFLDIMHKMRELVHNSADDWQAKVAELEKQRSAIDQQIRELQLTQKVVTYDDFQVEERYHGVNVLARSLLRDFREVEANFRAIAHKLYQQQSAAGQTKGSLLGLALDALDALRDTAQGRSFEAFYQHLTDPRQKAELDALIKQVFELLETRKLAAGDGLLRKIRFHLHGEGQKVNDSFHALARKLEKIVSEKNLRDRRRSLALIRAIRSLALETVNNPPEDVFLELDGKAEYLSTETQLNLEERTEAIVPRLLAVAAQDATELEPLVGPEVVDKAVLVKNISQLLRDRLQVSLLQVVAVYALRHGLAELMTYGSIAAASERHYINDQRRDLFAIGPGRACEFPEIIFCR